MKAYLVKSFEEDHSTKTLRGTKKVTFQTLDDIMRKRVIRPNTKSFGQRRRLSTTVLGDKYGKTYRPQGIIFQTDARPDYVLPFDLVLLSDASKIVVHYYRIQDNLHLYYNHNLIPGYERFVFRDIGAMMRKFPSPMAAWKAVNRFRVERGHARLPKSKFRLVEYNETVFQQPIKIVPVALFGYRSQTAELAKRYGLPHFRTAREFLKKVSGK